MALSDWGKYLVFSTAAQLWNQDWISNYYTHGSTVGANLRGMVLARQPVKPQTNPFDEAITGRLRADSRALKQNARNVREAGSMVSTAASAVTAIKSALQEMEALATDVKNGDMAYSDSVKNTYNALRDKIIASIEKTQFNGIKMLDSAKWGTSQIDSNGNVYVQGLADGGFDVTFQALDKSGLGALDGTNLNAAGTLQTELDTLSGFLGDMETIGKIYSRRAEGLGYQASTLESQAIFLKQAADARRQEPTKSIEKIVLELLMRTSGTLINEEG